VSRGSTGTTFAAERSKIGLRTSLNAALAAAQDHETPVVTCIG
jgi:hypothetical protein